MNRETMFRLAEQFIAAWNSQDVEQVLACYTHDAIYRDPNTRGAIQGAEPLRRYLTRLFAEWQMHWTLKEAFPFEDGSGCAVLWKAVLGRSGGGRSVDVHGMDFVALRDDRISRNEVYFDRALLAGAAAAQPRQAAG